MKYVNRKGLFEFQGNSIFYLPKTVYCPIHNSELSFTRKSAFFCKYCGKKIEEKDIGIKILNKRHNINVKEELKELGVNLKRPVKYLVEIRNGAIVIRVIKDFGMLYFKNYKKNKGVT